MGQGKQYCPVEKEAKIIKTSTPKFAKMVCNKYCYATAKEVQNDLEENHHRKVSCSFIRTLSQCVSNRLLAQEEEWEYEIAKIDQEITTIVIGIDGTCMPMGESQWREAMCGTFSLYDRQGKRVETIYIANAPEYGKASFKKRLDKEVVALQKQFPKATIIGIADGAKENWSILEQYTAVNTLDYYHATEYLAKASKGVHPRSETKRASWFENACKQLKHLKDGAKDLLEEFKALQDKTLPSTIKDGVEAAIGYFTNNLTRMNYKESLDNHFPIGSGVTESACKILIKQRVCVSGANWSEYGAKRLIPIRALCLTKGRWNQAWNYFMEEKEMVA